MNITNVDVTTAVDCQLSNEQNYAKQHINRRIRHEILSNDILIDEIELGVNIVKEFISENYNDPDVEKQARVQYLAQLDLKQLVTDIYCKSAYCQKAELFSSVVGKLNVLLDNTVGPASLTLMGEVLAVLTIHGNVLYTNAASKERNASLTLTSRVPLSNNLI